MIAVAGCALKHLQPIISAFHMKRCERLGKVISTEALFDIIIIICRLFSKVRQQQKFNKYKNYLNQ